MSSQRSPWRKALPWVALGVFLALVLEVLPKPKPTVFWGVVYNSGHTPLFGVGAIVLLQLSVLLVGDRVGRYWHHYVLAFMGVVVLGTASEGLQYFQAMRDADPMDLARDVYGAVIFLSVSFTMDARARQEFSWARSRFVRWVAGLALLANFVPIAQVALAYRHRAASFPVLAGFDDSSERWFYETMFASSTQRTTVPVRWASDAPGGALKMVFNLHKGARFDLLEPEPDWRGYEVFSADIYLDGSAAAQVRVQVRDRLRHDVAAERFDRALALAPGPNHVGILLADIQRGPATRTLSLDHIRSVTFIFSGTARTVATLYIGNVRLD